MEVASQMRNVAPWCARYRNQTRACFEAARPIIPAPSPSPLPMSPRFALRFLLVWFASLLACGQARAQTPLGDEFSIPLPGLPDAAVAVRVPAVDDRIQPVVDVGREFVDIGGVEFRRVCVSWPIDREMTLQQHAVTFDAGAWKPDFHWLPHLAPLQGTVVGQEVFRSPAILLGGQGSYFAVVPDLEALAGHRGPPWYLDLDATASTAWIGLAEQDRPIHVLYRRLPTAVRVGTPVRMEFWIASWRANGQSPFQPLRRFLWQRFARPQARTTPSVDFAQAAYGWAFDRWRDSMLIEVEVGGRQVVGTPFLVGAQVSPGASLGVSLPSRVELWNQAWFSGMRSASGLARWAGRTGRRDWLDLAKRMRNLALVAPRDGGLFPSVLVVSRQEDSQPQYRPIEWTGSDRVPFEQGIDRDWLHVADMTTTVREMLRWHREISADKALRTAVSDYVERLLQMQRADGHFPAWIDPDTHAASDVLATSVETAISATLLFEYVDAGLGGAAHRMAALRACDAVLPVARDGRWEDFETYWSDNEIGRTTRVGRRFRRNNLYKQNNLGMFWVAEAMLAAHRATGDASRLEFGVAVLDELSMTQQVWQPPSWPVPMVGGFGVMNADAEWNDARQALFAELYMDYYRATGESELFERGVAALDASFVMMHHPANTAVTKLWRERYPWFSDVDFGYHGENFGHQATRPLVAGMPSFAIFDWGAGSAAQAAARIHDRFGDVYVDRARGQAFGIDAVGVRPVGRGWLLSDLSGRGRTVTVRENDGSATEVRLNQPTEYR